MSVPRQPSKPLLVCGDASFPKGSNGRRTVRLAHENTPDGTKANVAMKLPAFVQDVWHLDDRMLDLLEIAAYVFAGDRRVSRGSSDALVFKAWPRTMHFVIRVRDFSFWNSKAVKDALSAALEFLTGDRGYRFVFQRGRKTLPTSIFDVPGVKLPHRPLTSVALFSGGLDSLAGALQILSQQDANVCLVSHRSGQTVTQKTQSSLIDAITERFKGRVTPYNFQCHLTSEPAADETQRSRSFLYTAIAFVVAAAHGLDSIHVFENGVTSINLPDRADMLNARASRTTHPKALNLIAKFLSLVHEGPFRILTPFLWNTKKDVASLLKRYQAEQLLTSSISCGRTRDRKESSTHCGVCSQCVDRRLAVWAAGLDADDEAKLYAIDFNKEEGSDDRLLATTLTDFLRQAAEFRALSREQFGLQHLTEISEIVPHLEGMSEEDAVTKLHDLCRRHGDHVWAGLRRIQEVFDDPLQPLKQGLLPQLIRTRAYLDHSGHELQRLMSTLESIHPGNDDAYTYERTIQGILTELFRGHLTDPVAQTVQDGGLRRVDITFRNISKEGFFDDVKFKRAPFILFECKNYSSDPAQGAFNQLRSNLGDGGKPEVGFLVCRRLVDRPHALQLCKSKYPEVLMMVLEDSDIGALVCAKMKGRSGDMWRELGDQMRGIVMKS